MGQTQSSTINTNPKIITEDIKVDAYQYDYTNENTYLITDNKQKYKLGKETDDAVNGYIDKMAEKQKYIKVSRNEEYDIIDVFSDSRLTPYDMKLDTGEYRHTLNPDYDNTEGFTKNETDELEKLSFKYKDVDSSNLDIPITDTKHEVVITHLIKCYTALANCMKTGLSLTESQLTHNLLEFIEAINTVDNIISSNSITHEYTFLRRICQVTTEENIKKWPLETTIDIAYILMGLLCDISYQRYKGVTKFIKK